MTKRALTSTALFLSLVGLVLLFVLDDLFVGSRPLFAPATLPGTAAVLAGMGAFAAGAQFLLTRCNHGAFDADWPLVLTLNWALLVVTAVSLVVEPNRAAAYATLAVALASLAGSVAGALAARRRTRWPARPVAGHGA